MFSAAVVDPLESPLLGAPVAAPTSVVTVIIALVLGLLGLSLLLSLLFLLLSPARKFFVFQKDRNRLKHALTQLAVVDGHLENEQTQEALKSLRSCFVFDHITDADLLDAYREHHQNVLSRCLIIAEDLGRRPEHLAEVEKLFLERTELFHLLLKAESSYRSLGERRSKEGKGIPTWSKADFESRISQIEAELSVNLKAVKKAIDELFRAMSSGGETPIVYH